LVFALQAFFFVLLFFLEVDAAIIGKNYESRQSKYAK